MSDVFVPKMALGLVHYPILDSRKSVIATNITNFDIHDIARASTVYGIDKYFLIHPMNEQLMFVDRILDHWRVGAGAKFNPFRRTALENVYTATSVQDAFRRWREDYGVKDFVTVATHARAVEGAQALTVPELKTILWDEKKPVFLLFGTGFGMTDDLMRTCDYVLEPIRGSTERDYRHLSVRSAVSIYLDRLMNR